MLATLYVWGSEDSSAESVFPFSLHMGSGQWTLVARLAEQAPCPLSYFFQFSRYAVTAAKKGSITSSK